MKSLFREEVLKAQRNQWLGEVSVLHPLPLRKILIGAVVLIITLAVFAGAITYNNHVLVSGTVVPTDGEAIIYAPSDGIVRSMSVAEGQRVSRDEPLIRLVTEHKTDEGDVSKVTSDLISTRKDSIQHSILLLEKQAGNQVKALELRKRSLYLELLAISHQREVGTQKAKSTADVYGRIKSLGANHYVSVIDEARAKNDLLSAESANDDLDRQRIQVNRQIEDAASGITSALSDERVQVADLQRQATELDGQLAANLGNRETVLSSPINGVVAARLAVTGQPVSAKDPILSIVPTGSKLEAHLIVPSTAIGVVKRGQSVLLAFDSFPYQQYGRIPGKVERVSLSSLPVKGVAAQFRIIVSLSREYVIRDQTHFVLRPGMNVQADITTGATGVYSNIFGSVREFFKNL